MTTIITYFNPWEDTDEFLEVIGRYFGRAIRTDIYCTIEEIGPSQPFLWNYRRLQNAPWVGKAMMPGSGVGHGAGELINRTQEKQMPSQAIETEEQLVEDAYLDNLLDEINTLGMHIQGTLAQMTTRMEGAEQELQGIHTLLSAARTEASNG